MRDRVTVGAGPGCMRCVCVDRMLHRMLHRMLTSRLCCMQYLGRARQLLGPVERPGVAQGVDAVAAPYSGAGACNLRMRLLTGCCCAPRM